MEWFEQALQQPPNIHLIRDVHRPVGETPTYNIQKHWAINLYTGPGHVAMANLDQRFDFNAGSVCLIPPNTERRFYFKKPSQQLVLSFDLPQPTAAIPNDFIMVPSRHHFTGLKNLFRECIQFHRLRQATRAQAVLWNLLWQCHDIFLSHNQDESIPSAVTAAVNYINRHLSSHPAASEITEAAGMSHNQLNRLFKAHFGCPMMQHSFHCRMQEAVSALESSDESIKDIALSLGYNNLQQFNKQFRRFQHMSPSAFRKKLRAMPLH